MVACVLCVCVCVSLPWPICTGSVMLLFSPVIILQLSGRLCCLDFSLHVCSSSISVRFLQVTKCCYGIGHAHCCWAAYMQKNELKQAASHSLLCSHAYMGFAAHVRTNKGCQAKSFWGFRSACDLQNDPLIRPCRVPILSFDRSPSVSVANRTKAEFAFIIGGHGYNLDLKTRNMKLLSPPNTSHFIIAQCSVLKYQSNDMK